MLRRENALVRKDSNEFGFQKKGKYTKYIKNFKEKRRDCIMCANMAIQIATFFNCRHNSYLYRQGAGCSTVTGVQGHSGGWAAPAAHSHSCRRSSVSPLPGRTASLHSESLTPGRQGSCMARMSPLGQTNGKHPKHDFSLLQLAIL